MTDLTGKTTTTDLGIFRRTGRDADKVDITAGVGYAFFLEPVGQRIHES